ncbi:MAG: MBL fold metallo-hydrolase [Anaerolineales bacterium]|jgi:glyoxylase-like metal-dependent hydrolase (beta-lactamase superfamily II)
MKIIANLYIVPDVLANTHILVDEQGLTLIDTGMPRSEKKILAYISELGKSEADLKYILLTHSDVDHVGALAALARTSGARTYASQIEAKSIAVGESSRRSYSSGISLRRFLFALLSPFFKAAPFQVDEILEEGQTLPALGGLHVIATPGHTPGHLSFYAPIPGVLFCGDSMVSDEDRLYGSRPGVTWDPDQARESVQKQAELGASIVCPGHGPVISDASGKFPI